MTGKPVLLWLGCPRREGGALFCVVRRRVFWGRGLHVYLKCDAAQRLVLVMGWCVTVLLLLLIFFCWEGTSCLACLPEDLLHNPGLLLLAQGEARASIEHHISVEVVV
jgi:hypothetical protein